MYSFRLTGRKKGARAAGRVNPAVRARIARGGINQSKIGTRPRAYRTGPMLPLTGTGIGLLVSGVIFVSAVLWFFVFSPRFLVNEVQIPGSTTLTTDQINSAFYELQDDRIFLAVPANHIIFFSQSRISKVLQRLYPNVAEAVDFERKWPNKVSFNILEKIPAFLLLGADGRRYVLDSSGFVIGEATSTIPGNVVMISTNTNDVPSIGSRPFALPVLDFALLMHDLWPPGWHFRPQEYRIITEQGEGEFAIFMNEKWYIKADGDDTPENLLRNLSLLIDNEIKEAEKRLALAYIDLRLPTRAFLCMRDQPCSK